MGEKDNITDNEVVKKKKGFLSTVFGSLFLSEDEPTSNDADIQKAVESMRAESEAGIKKLETQCFSSNKQQRRANLDKKLKSKGLELIENEKESGNSKNKRISEKEKVSDEEMER